MQKKGDLSTIFALFVTGQWGRAERGKIWSAGAAPRSGQAVAQRANSNFLISFNRAGAAWAVRRGNLLPTIK
jgi:hypothetical protein